MYTKHKHYEIDLEYAIIGACLLELTAFGRIRDFLKPNMFYSKNNEVLFSAISEMYERNIPIDILTATAFLARDKKMVTFEDGSDLNWFVTMTTNNVIRATNLEYHSLVLRQMYVERHLMRIRMSISTDQDSITEITNLQRELNTLLEIKSTDDWESMADVVIKLKQHIKDKEHEKVFGVTTGFQFFDKVYGGFGDTDLVVIAARPSVGKTAFVNKLCTAAGRYFKQEAIDNVDVLDYKPKCAGIISLEMSDIKLASRIASMQSGVEYWKIYRSKLREEEERQRLYKAFENMNDLPIYVSDTAHVDFLDIKGKAMKLKAKHNLKILFIDYLQLIDTPDVKGQTREREIAKLSRGLKLLAMEMKIPIILLAQLNRGSETEKDKKPKLHHLRESGAIEQDADGVILLHSDFMANIKTRDLMENDAKIGEVSTLGERDILVVKWRDGELGDYKVGWDGERMEFYEFGIDRTLEWQENNQQSKQILNKYNSPALDPKSDLMPF